ncbi:unnamed protein product [Lepeophtheirus salmonis]|uniref:(salmon louse) hypothetical protein n=1 Tax=Lepeophtheirus salmonis TaxID=72036 RepID=A0A7R8HC77_LEPSM|nr:unnamed protein product [Lepeophtheirus salmonis]CAF3002799.1 unnamed protein product [Lepeophtheirus salmonis]
MNDLFSKKQRKKALEKKKIIKRAIRRNQKNCKRSCIFDLKIKNLLLHWTGYGFRRRRTSLRTQWRPYFMNNEKTRKGGRRLATQIQCISSVCPYICTLLIFWNQNGRNGAGSEAKIGCMKAEEEDNKKEVWLVW